MKNTITYTVKTGDGYLAIARYIFNQSHRSYIQSLAKDYLIMKEAANSLESDLKHSYINFKLKVGQILKLHADPGYYIPRLALKADHGTFITKATKISKSTTINDFYFVIHSTDGNLKDDALENKIQNKVIGAGHAYINKDGKIFKIWPYNSPKGWATRTERTENKPELRGKLVNIELVYGIGEEPTEKQYQALADIYIETKELFGKWLSIAAHREIDRGIKGGHSDPAGFKFNYFYTILKNKSVPTDTIYKQTQARFNQSPWCEHKWSWPPELTSTTFAKVTDAEFIAKGCK